MTLWHRLRYGHWPTWEARDYDFLTWRWACADCQPDES